MKRERSYPRTLKVCKNRYPVAKRKMPLTLSDRHYALAIFFMQPIEFRRSTHAFYDNDVKHALFAGLG
jgi:hypothetical protein